jgi:N-acetylmuramoyl-L-alanine amidase
LKRLAGRRVLTAAIGLFMLSGGSSAASAQSVASPLGAAARTMQNAVSPVRTAATSAVTTATGSVIQATPASSVTLSLQRPIAREAAWLQQAGWPLYALVDRYSVGAPLDEQANCIAVAVYHEARGESLEGQLAVARVIMNRAASGRYPASWCGVVKQPWQFSFVRSGYMPSVDQSSQAWRNALGVTRLAINNAVQSVPSDCLWYHANYVSPSWGRRLTRVSQIGAHIFYRS